MVDPMRQRTIRFSLRTLLIILAILSLLSCWLGIQYSSCQHQSDVLAKLLEEGVSVYSYPKSDRFLDTKFRGLFVQSAHNISLRIRFF